MSNQATAESAAIGGGSANEATGLFSTIPGGQNNKATAEASFAAGRNAQALHEASIVFNDGFNGVLQSTGAGQFLIAAAGGVGIGTDDPDADLHISHPAAPDVDIKISATGQATMTLEADTDNVFESDNPMIEMRQDAGTVGMDIGFDEFRASNTFLIEPVWNFPTNTTSMAIRADNGDVGIGFEAPTVQLHVVDSINGTASLTNVVAMIENKATSTSEGPDVLGLRSSTPGASMSTSTNFITFFDGGGTAIGSIEGITGPGISLNTSGADYAEFIPKRDPSDQFQAGDIIGIFADGASHETTGALRAMVVSERPAVVGNRPIGVDEGEFEKTHVKAAFVGQVPVRVDGAYEIGDYLLASGSGNGTAVAVSPQSIRREDLDHLIGRVWKADDEDGLTKVVAEVGLDKSNVLSDILAHYETRLANVESQLATLVRAIAGHNATN